MMLGLLMPARLSQPGSRNNSLSCFHSSINFIPGAIARGGSRRKRTSQRPNERRMNSILFTTIGVIAFAQLSRADILELKNGTVLNGKYQGGTASTLRFKNDAGEQVIDTSQVTALTFTSSNNAPAPTASPVPIPSPTGRSASATTITIPAGTTLRVRM